MKRTIHGLQKEIAEIDQRLAISDPNASLAMMARANKEHRERELAQMQQDLAERQLRFAPLLDQHQIDEVHRRILQHLLCDHGLKSVLNFLVSPGMEELRAFTADVRALYYQEADDRIRPCEGGCGIQMPTKQFQVLDGVPGAVWKLLCEACLARETAREQRRLSRRSIRSAITRARAARLPATLTEGQWKDTLAFFNDACAYCGGPWYVVEHIIPIEQGGGTTRKNCVPACFSCNSTKGSHTLETWKPNSQEHLLAIRKWQDRE